MTEIETKKLADLIPDSQNANRGTERGRAMLESSLRLRGAGRSILLDNQYRIIAGNKTAEEAGQIGLDDVIVVRTKGDQLVAVLREDLDLSDDTTGAREMAHADNRINQVDYNPDPEQILADLNAGFNLKPLWDDGELNAILAGLQPEPKPDPGPQVDKAAQLAEKWGTQTGQVWQLGAHRLAVGDCTDKAVVEVVMRGERADLGFADPPYNANVDEWDKDFEWRQDWLIDLCDYVIVTPGIGSACEFLKKTSMPYKWTLAAYISNGYARSAVGFGWWLFAPLFSSNSIFRQKPDAVSIALKPGQANGYYHRGQKPPQFMEWIIGLYGDKLILDIFSGSGTTLIACEQLKRKCRAIEIDPGYCAVTLQRWADLTGQPPTLLG